MLVCRKPYSKHVVVFCKTPSNRSIDSPLHCLKRKQDTPPISSLLIADGTFFRFHVFLQLPHKNFPHRGKRMNTLPEALWIVVFRPPVLYIYESRLLQSVVETEDRVVDVILAGSGGNEVEKVGIVQGVLRVTDDNGPGNKNYNRLAIDRRLDVNGLGSVSDLSQTLDLLHDIGSSHDLISLKGHHGLFVLQTMRVQSRSFVRIICVCVICW